MSSYDYIAVNSTGIETKGTIEAFSIDAVSTQLREKQLVPISITEEEGLSNGLFSWWIVTTNDRTMILRQLAMMLRSGITVSSAIPELEESAYKSKIKIAFKEIQSDLHSGSSLSQAMLLHPVVFSSTLCGIVQAAEQTGELAPTFDRLANMLEYRQAIKKKLIMSFIYPGIVFLATIVVTYALFFSFIPKLSKFLLNLGKPLPPFTRKVFDFATALRENILWILLAAAIILLILIVTYKIANGRRFLESTFCRLPVFGKILIFSEVSMITSTLKTMMESGSSLITSLPLLTKSTSTLIFRDWTINAREKLMQGFPFQECMDKNLIPKTAQSVIKTGEKSGTLPEAFGELEKHYSSLLEDKINVLVALINPILIIIIGTIVAIVYIAIILAIVSVNGR